MEDTLKKADDIASNVEEGNILPEDGYDGRRS